MKKSEIINELVEEFFNNTELLKKNLCSWSEIISIEKDGYRISIILEKVKK